MSCEKRGNGKAKRGQAKAEYSYEFKGKVKQREDMRRNSIAKRSKGIVWKSVDRQRKC